MNQPTLLNSWVHLCGYVLLDDWEMQLFQSFVDTSNKTYRYVLLQEEILQERWFLQEYSF